jgi:hypothetical protein
MDANTLVDISDRTRDKRKEITIGPTHDGGNMVIRVSCPNDGNSICFTDYFGKSISVKVKLPSNEPVEGGTNRDALMSDGRSPCDCSLINIGGMQALVYFDDTGSLKFCDHH